MRLLIKSYFIVRNPSTANVTSAYVVAPPGYTRREADGVLYRDGSVKGGPEWGRREHAHQFRSHRAAARVANRCVGATIEAVHVPICSECKTAAIEEHVDGDMCEECCDRIGMLHDDCHACHVQECDDDAFAQSIDRD